MSALSHGDAPGVSVQALTDLGKSWMMLLLVGACTTYVPITVYSRTDMRIIAQSVTWKSTTHVNTIRTLEQVHWAGRDVARLEVPDRSVLRFFLVCLEPLQAAEIESNSVTMISLTADRFKAQTRQTFHSGHRII